MFIRYHQHLLVMDMTVFFCILSFYQQTLHRHQFTRCMAACPQCMRLPYLFQFYYHTLVQFKCMLCSVQCTIYYWKGHKGHILPYALMHTKRWLYWNAFSKGKWSERERERDSGGGKGKKKEMSEESGKKREKASTYSRFFFSFNTNSFGCSTLNNAINSALTAQHLLHLLLLQLWLSMGLRALCVDVDCGHIYSPGSNDEECESSESFSILYIFFQKG